LNSTDSFSNWHRTDKRSRVSTGSSASVADLDGAPLATAPWSQGDLPAVAVNATLHHDASKGTGGSISVSVVVRGDSRARVLGRALRVPLPAAVSTAGPLRLVVSYVPRRKQLKIGVCSASSACACSASSCGCLLSASHGAMEAPALCSDDSSDSWESDDDDAGSPGRCSCSCGCGESCVCFAVQVTPQ
jgi:hypothetical protein